MTEEEMEDTPTETKVLSPKGRFTRTKFCFWGTLFLILPRALSSGGAPTGLILFPFTFTFYIFAIIKRLRDINVSPWWALVAWIPVLNIPLLVIPGTKGANQYGPISKSPSIGQKILAVVLLVAAVGLFAAILLPDFQKNYAYYKHIAEQQKSNHK